MTENIHIKTDKELLIEFRNLIAMRRTEYIANAAYWKQVSIKAKKNTQEAVDSSNNVALNETNAKKDKAFLKVIDSLIK